MTIDRRSLVKYAAMAPVMGALPHLVRAANAPSVEKADYTLRIALVSSNCRPSTSSRPRSTTDNFPGRWCVLQEGKRVVVDVYNDTDTPELVHWHGQLIPSDVDGASEEGTPFIPPHGMRRIAFVPKAVGFSLLPYPRRSPGRPQPRHLYGPGWSGLHRACQQSRRV